MLYTFLAIMRLSLPGAVQAGLGIAMTFVAVAWNPAFGWVHWLSATATAAASLERASCNAGVNPQQLACLTLDVPEDYARPEGHQISLYIVVVPALDPKPGLPPLFELAGGPGNAATDSAPGYLDETQSMSRFRRYRDVVLVDQRGTGRSHPLKCTALGSAKPLDPVFPLPGISACRDALEIGGDLRQYTTENSARDLDRVRQALGYAQMDIWSISYGTILAQVYLKKFPERVRSMVLVGAAPIDNRFPLSHAASAQRVIEKLLKACDSDDRCHHSYPALEQEWTALLAHIEEAGLPSQREDPGLAAGTLGRDVFGEKFRNVLYSTGAQQRIPWLIHRAARGDFLPMHDALSEANGDWSSLGLYLSVTCNEGTARIDPRSIDEATVDTFLGAYRVRAQIDACAIWPKSAVADDFFEPVRSELPVLLLAGEMDVITPPSWSHLIAENLLNSRVVRFPHAGHIFWDSNPEYDFSPCYDDLAEQFYVHGNVQAIDTSCVTNTALPSFYLP